MSVFNKIVILNCFLLISICTDAQHEKIKTYFKDGKLESKGSMYSYSVSYDDKKIHKKFDFFGGIKKKEKEWKYWYQNGQLRVIEHYKLVIDKNFNDLPDGKWEYFNEYGAKYREDTYDNGTLISTTKEMYQDSKLAGIISLKNGVSDTSLYLPFTKDKNLIINPDFDFFYYKPVLITYHGNTKIEDWIPFWTTPGYYTPDFISNLRYIDVFSYSYLFDMPLPDKFQYVGIALYKESDNYSEYIQGKLITPLTAGKMYCLRTSINLCSYSKYSVNRLAFYFSSSPIAVDSKNEESYLPQVKFSDLPVENKHFTTLCNYFVATDGENIITVGRFSKPENIEVRKRENIPQGPFGLEQSAYYLIDNIELFEIQDTLECHCKQINNASDTSKNKSGEVYETDLNKLKQGISVVLENVNFDFDSFLLLKSSESILNILLNYLKNNPDIRISIEGHTDDIGTIDYNQELSVNRARSVYNWLINKGIDSIRLSFTGSGKSRPLYNDTEEKHRALNRRVEVRIIRN
jgi:OmpA-OmpF porin, OOP family